MNKLILGDNLETLKQIDSDTIDLIFRPCWSSMQVSRNAAFEGVISPSNKLNKKALYRNVRSFFIS